MSGSDRLPCTVLGDPVLATKVGRRSITSPTRIPREGCTECVTVRDNASLDLTGALTLETYDLCVMRCSIRALGYLRGTPER
jgi:hypothetical protein